MKIITCIGRIFHVGSLLAGIGHPGRAVFAGVIMSACAMSAVAAETPSTPTYYNASLLSVYGVPPQVLDLPLRFFDQGLKATMYLNMTVVDREGKERTFSRLELINDPFGPAGVESYIRIPKGEEQPLPRKHLEYLLEDYMGLHFVAREASHLYDESSLRLLRETPEETVIEFRYRENLLYGPAEILSQARGTIHIENGRIDRIVVRTDQPYRMGGVQVVESESIYYLYPVPPNRGYLLKGIRITERTGEGTTYVTTGTIRDYVDREGRKIVLDTAVAEGFPASDEATMVRVNLNRKLPLWGREVRKMGFQLPKPYGISLFTHFQDELMKFTSFNLEGVDMSDFITPDGSSSLNRTVIAAVRADVWVLPFLSLNAMIGKARTDSEITLKGGPLGVPDPDDPIFSPPILAPGESITFTEKTDTDVIGFGGTLGFGYQNLFTTLDVMYVRSVTASVNIELDALAITPMIGYSVPKWRSRFMVGGQYQEYDLDIKGELPGIGRFVVGQSLDRWTYLIGAQRNFLRNWDASLMLASGESRKSATVVLGYRF